MKVKLKTGKVVEFVPEFGPGEYIKAAELSGVPANMSYAEDLLLGIATVMVAIVGVRDQVKPAEVDPETREEIAPAQLGPVKTVQDLNGNAVDTKTMLLNFRKTFTDFEWNQVQHAFGKVFSEKKGDIEDYEIQG